MHTTMQCDKVTTSVVDQEMSYSEVRMPSLSFAPGILSSVPNPVFLFWKGNTLLQPYAV